MAKILSSLLNITSTVVEDEDEKCNVCEESIKEEENVFDCDSCGEKIHMTCAEGRKSEINARKRSLENILSEMYGTTGKCNNEIE